MSLSGYMPWSEFVGLYSNLHLAICKGKESRIKKGIQLFCRDREHLFIYTQKYKNYISRIIYEKLEILVTCGAGK